MSKQDERNEYSELDERHTREVARRPSRNDLGPVLFRSFLWDTSISEPGKASEEGQDGVT